MPPMMPRTAPAATTLISAADAWADAITATTAAAGQNRDMGSGVADVAGEHARADAELLHGALVLALDVGAEDQLGVGVAVQPAVVLQLVLELARRPPGIAEREDRAGRP